MASSSSQTAGLFHHFAPRKINDAVYEFYKPPTGFIDLDIVFFHGFQEQDCPDGYLKTWMLADESACWLNAWLPENFPQSRILSVSYDSSTEVTDSEGRMDMYLVGESLARSIIELAGVGQTSPVVLVGHCVGGLVLKEVCCRAEQIGTRLRAEGNPANPYETFLRSMKGAFFFSTAQMGSRIQTDSKQGGPLVKYSELLSNDSARLTSDFSKLRKRDSYQWKTGGVSEANQTETDQTVFRWLNFFNRMFGRNQQDSLVVEEASARIDVDTFCVLEGTNSLTVCKPKDRNSTNYQLLVKFVTDILEEEGWILKQWQSLLHFPLLCKSMPNRVEQVLRTLQLGQAEPSRVSLVGMGGIGKTTLAKQVLMEIASQFHFVCFVEDVKDRLTQHNLHTLISNNLYYGNGYKVSMQGADEKSLWLRLRGKKVLLIMDNVDSEEEIHILLVPDWVAKGSRLITTSRVQPHELMPSFVMHNVPFLSREETTSLFLAYIDVKLLEVIPRYLIDRVVEKCDGLPLTVVVIGSYLRLENDVSVWDGALDKLSKAESINGSADDRLWAKLRISFESLGATERRMFLDLAVFDNCQPDRIRYHLHIWKTVWEAGVDGLSVNTGLRNLIDKSFIRTTSEPNTAEGVGWMNFAAPSEDASYFYIHEQLRDMGRSICRPIHERVELCRGVWKCTDVEDLLVRCKRNNAHTETLSVVANRNASSIALQTEYQWSSVGELQSLRLLKLSDVGFTGENSQRFPFNLALLHMTRCSAGKAKGKRKRDFLESDCWPIRAEDVGGLHNLSVLILENCLTSVRLPENFHELSKLRILIISGEHLKELPRNFGLLPSLQVLFLSRVTLSKLPASFRYLSTLEALTLSSCHALKSLLDLSVPRSGHWERNACSPLLNLKRLTLEDLPALTELPEIFGLLGDLEDFRLGNCHTLSKLPESFAHCFKLEVLEIKHCEGLEYLCESFGDLVSLADLTLSSCPHLDLPDSLGQLNSLQTLYIEDLGISSLPASFGNLGNLRYLWLRGLAQLKALPVDCMDQRMMTIEDSRISQNLPGSDSPNGLPEEAGLRWLHIVECESLESLAEVMAYGHTHALEYMSILRCRRLQRLPETVGLLTRLERLTIEECESLKYLPETVGLLTNLQELEICRCESLEYLPETLGLLTSLQMIGIQECESLESLPEFMGDGHTHALERMTVRGCRRLLRLPESLGLLSNLKQLKLQECESIQRLPESIGQLRNLLELSITNCDSLEGLPTTVVHLGTLQKLFLYGCPNFRCLPEAIGQLKNLETLSVGYCERLERLPEFVGQLKAPIALRFFNRGEAIRSLIAREYEKIDNQNGVEYFYPNNQATHVEFEFYKQRDMLLYITTSNFVSTRSIRWDQLCDRDD